MTTASSPQGQDATKLGLSRSQAASEPWVRFHQIAAVAGWRKCPGFLCEPTLVSPRYWLLKVTSTHLAESIVGALRRRGRDVGDPHFGFLKVESFGEAERLNIEEDIRRSHCGEVRGIESDALQRTAQEAARIEARLSGSADDASDRTNSSLILPADATSECFIFVRRYFWLLRPFPFEEFDPLPQHQAQDAMVAYAMQ